MQERAAKPTSRSPAAQRVSETAAPAAAARPLFAAALPRFAFADLSIDPPGQSHAPAQLRTRPARPPRPNRTGLPDHLKSGVEALSGVSLDGVKVHYGSQKPAGLNAHAYAQGREIHLAPGQEHHLPHEIWHVVQQAQGRVKPTLRAKGGAQINDDSGLEREADAMGAKAMAQADAPVAPQRAPAAPGPSIQRKTKSKGSALTSTEKAAAEVEGAALFAKKTHVRHGKGKEKSASKIAKEDKSSKQQVIDRLIQLKPVAPL